MTRLRYGYEPGTPVTWRSICLGYMDRLEVGPVAMLRFPVPGDYVLVGGLLAEAQYAPQEIALQVIGRSPDGIPRELRIMWREQVPLLRQLRIFTPEDRYFGFLPRPR